MNSGPSLSKETVFDAARRIISSLLKIILLPVGSPWGNNGDVLWCILFQMIYAAAMAGWGGLTMCEFKRWVGLASGPQSSHRSSSGSHLPPANTQPINGIKCENMYFLQLLTKQIPLFKKMCSSCKYLESKNLYCFVWIWFCFSFTELRDWMENPLKSPVVDHRLHCHCLAALTRQ